MASPESKAVRQFLLNHKKAQSGKPFSVEETRRELEAMFGNRPVDPDVRIEKVTIGGIPAEWMSAPNAEGKCAFLYLHGGGTAWEAATRTGVWRPCFHELREPALCSLSTGSPRNILFRLCWRMQSPLTGG